MDFTPFTTLSTPFTPHPPHPDIISILRLHLTAQPALDHWNRPSPQPLLLTLSLYTDITPSSASDTLPPGLSIHYGDLTRSLTHAIPPTFTCAGLLALADAVAETCFRHAPQAEAVRVVAEFPEASVVAEGVGVEAYYRNLATPGGRLVGLGLVGRETQGSGSGDGRDESPNTAEGAAVPEASLFIRGIRCLLILGMNPPERTQKQYISVSLRLWGPSSTSPTSPTSPPKPHDWYFRDYASIIAHVVRTAEASAYQTLETLILEIARAVCLDLGIACCTARVEKPSALTFAQAAAVEITRTRSQFGGV